MIPGPQADRANALDHCRKGRDRVTVEHGENGVEMHVGAVFAHQGHDDPLGRPPAEECAGDFLDHPCRGSLAEASEHRAIANRHDVTALQRCRAEEVEAEWATVSGQVRVPEFPVGSHEHGVVAVDGQQV